MWHLSADLSGSEVNRVAAALPEGSELHLDLSSFSSEQPFASSAVHGLVSLAQKRRVALVLHTGRSVAELKTTRSLVRSATGFLLLQAAHAILDHENRDQLREFRAEQATLLAAFDGRVPLTDGFALPAVDNTESAPRSSPLLDIEHRFEFRRPFTHMLETHLGPEVAAIKGVDRAADFCFEIVSNMRKHARTNINGYPVRGCRLLVTRILSQPAITELAASRGPVEDYLTKLGDIFGNYVDCLLEITASDSGVGIPARVEQTMSFYEHHDVRGQRQALYRALTERGTTQKGVVGAGLGLPQAMQAVYDSRGLVLFRTGHLHMFRHYLSGQAWPATDLQDATGPADFYAGTAVTLLLPRFHAN